MMEYNNGGGGVLSLGAVGARGGEPGPAGGRGGPGGGSGGPRGGGVAGCGVVLTGRGLGAWMSPAAGGARMWENAENVSIFRPDQRLEPG